MRLNDYIYGGLGGLGGIQNLKLEPVYEGIPSEDEDEVSDEVLNPKAYKLTWDPFEGANSYVIYRAQISLDKKSAEELEEIPFALEENLDAALEKYADKSAKGTVFLEIGMTAETVYVDKTLGRDKDYYYYVKGFKADTTKRVVPPNYNPPDAETVRKHAANDDFDDIEYGKRWFKFVKSNKVGKVKLFTLDKYKEINNNIVDSIDKCIINNVQINVKEVIQKEFITPSGLFSKDDLKNFEEKGGYKTNGACVFRTAITGGAIYYAHSSVDKTLTRFPSYKELLKGFTVLQDNKAIEVNKIWTLKDINTNELLPFKAYNIDDGTNPYRYYDTEYKLLTILDLEKEKPINENEKIILFSEIVVCDSCKNVFLQFHNKHQNVEIDIIYGQGIYGKIKN